MAFVLTSNAFRQGTPIPAAFTADGRNVSPQLSWEDAPAGTISFALICDDPDAPAGTWVHWVICNIPSDIYSLDEHVDTTEHPFGTAVQGKNDFGRFGYGGPSPPSGTHRYFFKLYAVDSMLTIPSGYTKNTLIGALKNHILAETQLMGTYSR